MVISGGLSLLFSVSMYITLFTLYAMVIIKLKASTRRIESLGRINRLALRQARANRNVVILLSTYIFCKLCLDGMVIRYLSNPSIEALNQIEIGATIYAMNSLANPIIYGARSQPYQRILKQLFRRNRQVETAL